MGKGKSIRGLRASLRKPLTTEGEKVTKKELPIIRERILASSISDEWDEARREWELVGYIEEEDYESLERFSDNCSLCNQGGLRRNYEIYNSGTGKRFLVGSTCIKKFIILKGAETQDQSSSIFEFRVKQIEASKRLQAILPSILTQPTQYEALLFRNASKEILETLDINLIKGETWYRYTKLLFGNNPPEKALDKIRTVLFQPTKIVYKKVTDLSTGEEEGRWAHKRKVKTRVETTLARSNEDRPGKRD